MAYCQECGSEVAPEDAFCPYCGIALQSVIPSAESRPNVEPSVNSDVSESLTNSVNSSATDVYQKPSDSPTDPVNSEKAEKSPAESEDDFADDSPFKAEKNDEFAPQTDISESEETVWDKTVDISPETKVADYSAVDKAEITDKPEISEIFDENKQLSESETESAKTDFDDSPRLKQESDQPTDEKENPASDLPENFEKETVNPPVEHPAKMEDERFPPLPELSELPADPESLQSPVSAENNQKNDYQDEAYKDDDFSATIPYTPREVSESDSQDANVLSEPNSPMTESAASFDENQPVQNSASEKIDKEDEFRFDTPQNPLPVNEKTGSTPVFITIQPKEEPENIESSPVVEPKISSPVVEPKISSPVVEPKIENSAPVAEVKEGRSYTSPNIGVSDTDGKKAAKLKPLDEGTVLNGRYEIVRKIGGGGMGAVYLASDQNLGGVLRAVKEMVQSYIEDEQQEKAINDFRRESMILSTLDHPSIPTIYDYFYDEKESRFYLVMKYINGGDLAARLRSSPEGRLDEKTVTEWAVQIADVLDYLHNRPTTIIYRDLKPSNVMIDGNSGRIMLIDFGIARSVNKEEKGVTAVGTMGYAPPELFSGNVEPRSDIYSLGSTMFHLLTGADPQSNPLLIFDFNKNPRPRQINSRLSDQIEQILMRAVEYNSAQRFNSAADLREVLKQHLENLQKGMVTYGVSSTTAAKAQSPINAAVFCGFCGQKIVAMDMFCPFCGAKQPSATQAQVAPAAPAFVAPKLTARLMVIGTNELDAPEFSLEKDNNLVGRRDPMSNIFPEVDLSKFDPQTKISRKHARIWKENNSYLLEDLGSSNGTVLMPAAKDSVRLLPRQPHILTHGDKIRVGDTTLHFFIG